MSAKPIYTEGGLVVPRSFSFASVVGAVMYVAAASYYTAHVTDRVAHLEIRDIELRKRLDERADANAKRIEALELTKDRLTRVESQLEAQGKILLRIEAILDRRPM